MKVAQEIDVDGVTIIINAENKLEAVGASSEEQASKANEEVFKVLNLQLEAHPDTTLKFQNGAALVKSLTVNVGEAFNGFSPALQLMEGGGTASVSGSKVENGMLTVNGFFGVGKNNPTFVHLLMLKTSNPIVHQVK